MPATKHTRAYGANMSSLNGLEQTCEADEANLPAQLVSLELAKFEDGTKVTKAIYEDSGEPLLGELIFEVFKDDVDAGSRTAIHKAHQPTQPLVCKGQAFINNKATNVIVFRG
ncbi:MAG: hypothetical protein JO360_12875 [Acidobacteria bacterium]|nr:hypothetical protein [Acidobacteriota bacterium]